MRHVPSTTAGDASPIDMDENALPAVDIYMWGRLCQFEICVCGFPHTRYTHTHTQFKFEVRKIQRYLFHDGSRGHGPHDAAYDRDVGPHAERVVNHVDATTHDHEDNEDDPGHENNL